MPACKKCGRKGLFLLVSPDGLCNDCRKTALQAENTVHQINEQVHTLTKEREKVQSCQELTPSERDGHTRSYHYKDVNIYVGWQYGGGYGKTCKSIGMRRGDLVKLIARRSDDDPEQVVAVWHDLEIGTMKSNRLRGMVRQWQAAKLPVQCVVAAVGGEQKLLLEFAFYGKPKPAGRSAGTSAKADARMMKIIKKSRGEFVAFDVETTGLDPNIDRIIEISAVRFTEWAPSATFSSLICANRKISASASAVNGITDKDLKNAPIEAEVMKAFSDFIGSGGFQGDLLMVAHNASFDKSFVESALHRCGIPCDLTCEDTLLMSRRLLPGLDGYTLSHVATALQVEQTQAHRATDDALVCGKIFVELAKMALSKSSAKSMEPSAEMSTLEKDICTWVCATLNNAGCDLTHLSFNVSGYLSVNCWHLVARFKPRAKKPYVLVEKSLFLPDAIETTPATKSEGEDLKRVYFGSIEDLGTIADWLVSQYRPIAAETSRFWEMGSPYQKDILSIEKKQYRPQQ